MKKNDTHDYLTNQESEVDELVLKIAPYFQELIDEKKLPTITVAIAILIAGISQTVNKSRRKEYVNDVFILCKKISDIYDKMKKDVN